MKPFLFAALAVLAAPAAATGPANKAVLSSRTDAAGEHYVVADRALAKIVHFRDQICASYGRAQASFDAAYGSASVGEATAETAEEMVSKLKDVQSLKASCDQNNKAAAARVDILLGSGAGARLRSSSVFEGKVSVTLNLPAPKSEDEETWRRIEEGWKHGAACP